MKRSKPADTPSAALYALVNDEEGTILQRGEHCHETWRCTVDGVDWIVVVDWKNKEVVEARIAPVLAPVGPLTRR